MEIEQTQAGDDWVIRLRGELDMASAELLASAIKNASAGEGSGRVIVDLAGVRFMDSAGLRVLLRANLASEQDGGRLRLRRGPRSVQRVFEVTGTDSLLPFE
jgi:anti-sigma B factor antagonist